ncbi:MAG: hypothetical protein H6984_12095 [Pseudomonadales bacterium]|nr:hypothetical protein [Halioglobus sp.]MCP5123189.1 hypothetical protein [Pseudomonadales bacterium]MCP5192834.1 hypothetical protein [Pseudomonadales bacterium]
MADLHIDDFYRDVASIFLRLYAVFPRKTILYVEDVCGPDQPDEFGLHHPRFQAGFSAMVWLAEHGYLHFQETIRAEALDQAVLSRRAFLLLSSRSELGLAAPAGDAVPPSVAEYSRSNITQLRAALREGSSINLQKCVTYLLSQPPIGGA